MRHNQLASAITRPPGVPPSSCPGELYRVDGSGDAIPDDADPILDDAQPGEGDIGDVTPVRLWRCGRCRQTLVVSGEGDKARQRNEWIKGEPAKA